MTTSGFQILQAIGCLYGFIVLCGWSRGHSVPPPFLIISDQRGTEGPHFTVSLTRNIVEHLSSISSSSSSSSSSILYPLSSSSILYPLYYFSLSLSLLLYLYFSTSLLSTIWQSCRIRCTSLAAKNSPTSLQQGLVRTAHLGTGGAMQPHSTLAAGH